MENSGKTAVFRADMAGLGKYSMGGYGWIGVYRVMGEQIMVGMDLYCYGRKALQGSIHIYYMSKVFPLSDHQHTNVNG